jgi:hypothetical protein
MGRRATGSPTVLDVVLHHWPSLVLVPAVLLLVAVLVGVTRWWDRKDEALRVAGRTAPTTQRLRLRRRAVCTCSWHTVGVEAGAEGR